MGSGALDTSDLQGPIGRFSIHLDSQECVELTFIRGGNIRLEKAKIAVILEVHACIQAEPPSSSIPTTTRPSDLANTTSGIVTDSGMVAATPAALIRSFYFQLGDPSPGYEQLALNSR